MSASCRGGGAVSPNLNHRCTVPLSNISSVPTQIAMDLRALLARGRWEGPPAGAAASSSWWLAAQSRLQSTPPRDVNCSLATLISAPDLHHSLPPRPQGNCNLHTEGNHVADTEVVTDRTPAWPCAGRTPRESLKLTALADNSMATGADSGGHPWQGNGLLLVGNASTSRRLGGSLAVNIHEHTPITHAHILQCRLLFTGGPWSPAMPQSSGSGSSP